MYACICLYINYKVYAIMYFISFHLSGKINYLNIGWFTT